MGEQVRVESFEALRRLRAALCRFAEVVGAAMGEVDAEMQRERAWVNSEQSSYWKEEARKRAEALTKAKIALAGKKAQVSPLGGRPSRVEEEKELARALRRVEEAERKLAGVQFWRRRLDEEVFSYQTAASGMSQALIVDIPNSLAHLDKMLAALEAYAATAEPAMQGSQAEGETQSVARVTPASSPAAGEYSRLRASTPSQAVRQAVPLTELGQGWRLADRVEPTWLADFKRLGLGREPVHGDGKVVLSRGASQQPKIYLERSAAAVADDSGWYVGSVAPDAFAAAELEAARAAELVAARPDLASLLELPPGYLAVLNGAKLEAVLDAEDRQVWPAAGSGKE